MFRTLFLDADDTVFDFGAAQRAALEESFRTLGYPFNEEIYGIYDGINIKYWKKLERGETVKEKLVYDRFYELFGETGIKGDVLATENAYQSNLGKYAFWLEGAKEGVRYLSGKYDVYITTNGHGDTQTSRLRISGLDKMVKGVFISEIIGYAKPRAEYYDYCLKESGAEKDMTLCIGDSLTSDIKGGINSGIKTMWCNFKGEETPKLKIDYIVRDWKDICSIL